MKLYYSQHIFLENSILSIRYKLIFNFKNINSIVIIKKNN